MRSVREMHQWNHTVEVCLNEVVMVLAKLP